MKSELLKTKNFSDDEDDFFDEDEEDTLENKYLVFVCDKKLYSLEIRYVTEIVAMQPITEVPNLPPSIMGIINLRGKVLPVLDVRIRFNVAKREYDERTCIIIASMDNSSIGLIVDAVNEVEFIPESEIEPPPKMGDSINSKFVKGIGKSGEEVKIILDLKNLIHESEVPKSALNKSESEIIKQREN
ncbi:MAG: chemotaxis protein CheW [Leptospiraceae bacterium]|nr:chemotaxis protein CheW [Leptospiraceae bacterium]MCK6382042.1 chemotaxis protein CheW [Leptospiraceae bacterium]NUM40807.1 chemotaxis protein CheW [Leptospiraceae bacterium]